MEYNAISSLHQIWPFLKYDLFWPIFTKILKKKGWIFLYLLIIETVKDNNVKKNRIWPIKKWLYSERNVMERPLSKAGIKKTQESFFVMAWYRPNSEIIGNFRKFQNFYGHFVKRQNWYSKIPIRNIPICHKIQNRKLLNRWCSKN